MMNGIGASFRNDKYTDTQNDYCNLAAHVPRVNYMYLNYPRWLQWGTVEQLHSTASLKIKRKRK